MKIDIDFDHIQPNLIYQIIGDELIQWVKYISEEAIKKHSENAIRKMQLEKEKYLSVLETAELLSVTRQTLLKLEKKGVLRPLRPNGIGKIFYKLSDVKRYMGGS